MAAWWAAGIPRGSGAHARRGAHAPRPQAWAAASPRCRQGRDACQLASLTTGNGAALTSLGRLQYTAYRGRMIESSAMNPSPRRTPLSRLWTESPAAVLDYELAQEKASALGRLGRRLEWSLAALAEFDAQQPPGAERTVEAGRKRAALVAAAGTALGYFVVQREACGLRDGPQVFRLYGVPGEVVARMGAR